jgi:uncharacterized protein (UPF0210 family)
LKEAYIRSVTIHLPKPKEWSLEGVESLIEDWSYRVLEVRDRIVREVDIDISSLRLTLPNVPTDILRKSELLTLKEEEVLVNIGSVPYEYELLEDSVSSLARNGIYSHVTIKEPNWKVFRRLAKLFNRLSEEDPEYATKFGVNLSQKEILTPYYPLSWSPGAEPLLSICLVYPSALEAAYRSSGIKGIKDEMKKWANKALEVGRLFSKELRVEFVGVDLSVSPWMENSVLSLIESISGVRMPSPGIAYGISLVNKIIKEVSNEVKATGFNEVQLPLGEDSKLKVRAVEGELKARDLARLSGACLAGLDMVVVPYDEIGVAGLMLEVSSYAREDKPLGVRLITLDGVEPGDKVATNRFGEIPVIPI